MAEVLGVTKCKMYHMLVGGKLKPCFMDEIRYGEIKVSECIDVLKLKNSTVFENLQKDTGKCLMEDESS